MTSAAQTQLGVRAGKSTVRLLGVPGLPTTADKPGGCGAEMPAPSILPRAVLILQRWGAIKRGAFSLDPVTGKCSLTLEVGRITLWGSAPLNPTTGHGRESQSSKGI